MWKVNANRYFQNKNLVLIDSDYEDLAYHDFPILFTGKNTSKDRIVGSFVERSEIIETHLHSLVDAKTFSQFENQIITYLELLQKAQFLWQVQYNEQNEASPYFINYSDIPSEYLPSADARCPSLDIKKTSLEIETSLEKGRVDQNVIPPEVSNPITKYWADFFRDLFKLDALKEASAEILLHAKKSQLQAEGSVKINYQINLTEKHEQTSAFFDLAKYTAFAELYIKYCLNHLMNDAPILAKKQYADLPQFSELVESYKEASIKPPGKKESYEESLAKNLLRATRKLGSIGDHLGSDVGEIQVSSLFQSTSQSLGVFDGQVATEFEASLEEVEKIESHSVMVDSEPTLYQDVQIYDLNTNSRKGRALLPKVGKIVPKPRITISGDEGLERTKYTASLHRDEVIEVLGVGTKVDGILKKLEIVYDDDGSYSESTPMPDNAE